MEPKKLEIHALKLDSLPELRNYLSRYDYMEIKLLIIKLLLKFYNHAKRQREKK